MLIAQWNQTRQRVRWIILSIALPALEASTYCNNTEVAYSIHADGLTMGCRIDAEPSVSVVTNKHSRPRRWDRKSPQSIQEEKDRSRLTGSGPPERR